MKKFELTSEFVTNIFGTKLFRIKALVEFGNVKAGDLGGYIEKEENLDHDGDAWVYGDAWVSGDARVFGDARVSGDAWVFGDARVSGDARVFGDARVSGDARVFGDADYAYAHGVGSINRTTTFFRLKDGGVGVRCGCFYGTLQEFRDKVRETHGESKTAELYLDLSALMEKRFRREKDE